MYLDERVAEKVKTSNSSACRVAFVGERWLLQMRRERMPLCGLLLCCFPLTICFVDTLSSFNELSIPPAPSAGLWCCEEIGFSAVCLPLIVSKLETREGETFHFPVSFSAIKVIDGQSIQPGHCLCQAHLDWAPIQLRAGKDTKKECL